MYEKVKEIIETMSNELGIPEQFLWDTLVQQQKIDAITNLMLLPILIGLIILVKNFYDKINYDEDIFNISPFKITLFTFTLLATIFAFLLFTSSFNSIVTGLINPEYGAIQDILDKLSSN